MSAVRDAIVVGAGPAGAVAATLFARAGWDVALLERRTERRGKSCGHCLSAAARRLAHHLGLGDAVEAASLGEITSLRIEVADRALTRARGVTVVLPSERRGRLIDRAALDAGLVERARGAGADVIRPGSVNAVAASDAEPSGERHRWRRAHRLGVAAPAWRVSVRGEPWLDDHEMECALLVGADGLGSGVARRLGWSDPRPGRAFGFSLDVPAEAMPGLDPGQIRMHVVPGGYLGAVRSDATSSIHVGALVHADVFEGGPKAFAARVGRFVPEAERLADAIGASGASLGAGPMPWRPRTVSGPGAALIGDAAGFVEPFTGEGMAWAFASAALLAEAAGRPRRGVAPIFGTDAASLYAASWRRMIGRAHRRCGWASAVAARPRLLAAGFALAPELASAVAPAFTWGRGPQRDWQYHRP